MFEFVSYHFLITVTISTRYISVVWVEAVLQVCCNMQVIGTLQAHVAEKLGLGTDVVVAPGSGDNQMSALGAGAVREGSWVGYSLAYYYSGCKVAG